MICPMTNHYQIQSAAVDKRIKELEEAKSNDDVVGMNALQRTQPNNRLCTENTNKDGGCKEASPFRTLVRR
jgi:hypothetical protein